MKSLFMKEMHLALQPINLLFLLLSAMLLIPNYVYYVTFFYTSLGLFFLCQSGRENHDIEFTMMLPVGRRDLVRARLLCAVVIEMAQLALAIPFALINQRLCPFGNLAGMDANVTFFGLSLVLLGVFNMTFFPVYYGHPTKVGRAFVIACAAEAVYIFLAELAAHKVTYVRRYLDTIDPAYMGAKLMVLGAGAVLFAGLTLAACRLSERRFEKVDL